MIHKNLIFLFSFFVFHFSPALDSKISLDTLLNSRIIIQDHADLFDKVSVQDATDRIKPFHTVSSELLRKITSPTLLVWGLNDTITPPSVAHEFNRLIKNSKIKFIDNCCHAPMMEHPKLFNKYIVDFLK